jgi:hypothetical protein
MAQRRVGGSGADEPISGKFPAQHVKDADVEIRGCVHNVASRKVEQHMLTTTIRRRPHHLGIDSDPIQCSYGSRSSVIMWQRTPPMEANH